MTEHDENRGWEFQIYSFFIFPELDYASPEKARSLPEESASQCGVFLSIWRMNNSELETLQHGPYYSLASQLGRILIMGKAIPKGKQLLIIVT